MKKIIIAGSLAGIILLSMILMIFMGIAEDEDEIFEGTDYATIGLSAEVLAYKDLVMKYCKQYDIEDHINIILAIMMVESGGRGNDVMQASESLGLPRNTLMPEESIKQGCNYFSQSLYYAESKGCDVWTAVQGYNCVKRS